MKYWVDEGHSTVQSLLEEFVFPFGAEVQIPPCAADKPQRVQDIQGQKECPEPQDPG